MVRNEHNTEKRHLQLTANVLCCFRVMGFLWAIRQHDGSVGTREAGWSSAGSAQGQEFTHTLSITHTHAHTLMVVSPNPNINDLNPLRLCFKSTLAERVQQQGPAKAMGKKITVPLFFFSLIPPLHPMRINLSLNRQYYV